LTCYRTRRRIGGYLDGALDPETARSTAAHLASCGRCQGEAGELRRLRGLLQGTVSAAEPDWTGFWQGVVRGIEDQRHARPAPARRPWWQLAGRPRWALGGALAAVLMSLGVWQWAPGPHLAPLADAGVLVTSASTEDPRGTVMVYSTPEQDVAVVWVFGLDKD
jgi:anti-sigma factor RsiW